MSSNVNLTALRCCFITTAAHASSCMRMSPALAPSRRPMQRVRPSDAVSLASSVGIEMHCSDLIASVAEAWLCGLAAVPLANVWMSASSLAASCAAEIGRRSALAAEAAQ